MMAKATSSAKKVASGMRKFPAARVVEVAHEREVDEVHRLDETHGDVEQRAQPSLGLGLPRHTGDVLATGQTVADAGTDGAAGEGQPAADHGAGKGDGVFDGGCCGHFPVSPMDEGAPAAGAEG
jgi:hypothetical protein